MNSQKTSKNVERKNVKHDKRASRKILIWLFIIVIVVVILSLAIVGFMKYINTPKLNTQGTLIFYEADYEYDIFSDKNYLDLDRNIYFENTENGHKVALENNNFDDVPVDQHRFVSVLCDYINHAINGRSTELNSLFSKEYVDAGGKTKIDFTMQQLYNIKIAYIENNVQMVDGTNEVSYDYWLEYMIRNNNGTFRSDMASDCIRKEYVRVTDRNGRIGIDVLAPYQTATLPDNIEVYKIISILAVFLITILISMSLYFYMKRRVKKN